MNYFRPEMLVTFLPPPRRPWWRRALNAVSAAGWAILSGLAPSFPIVGAYLGYLVARAFL